MTDARADFEAATKAAVKPKGWRPCVRHSGSSCYVRVVGGEVRHWPARYEDAEAKPRIEIYDRMKREGIDGRRGLALGALRQAMQDATGAWSFTPTETGMHFLCGHCRAAFGPSSPGGGEFCPNCCRLREPDAKAK